MNPGRQYGLRTKRNDVKRGEVCIRDLGLGLEFHHRPSSLILLAMPVARSGCTGNSTIHGKKITQPFSETLRCENLIYLIIDLFNFC